VRRFICVYLCVLFAFLFCTAYVLYYCEHGVVDLMGLKPNP